MAEKLVFVPLFPEERRALADLAERNSRSPSEEMRRLWREEMVRLGLGNHSLAVNSNRAGGLLTDTGAVKDTTSPARPQNEASPSLRDGDGGSAGAVAMG